MQAIHALAFPKFECMGHRPIGRTALDILRLVFSCKIQSSVVDALQYARLVHRKKVVHTYARLLHGGMVRLCWVATRSEPLQKHSQGMTGLRTFLL